LQGLFTMKLTTEGLEIKLFIEGILLLKGSLYRGYSVYTKTRNDIDNVSIER
jgi:hypothetical protein